MACAGLTPADIDLLVVGTSSPDHIIPVDGVHHPGQARTHLPGRTTSMRHARASSTRCRPAAAAIESGRYEHRARHRRRCADAAHRLHRPRNVRALRRRRRSRRAPRVGGAGRDGDRARRRRHRRRPAQDPRRWLGGTVHRGTHPEPRAVRADERQRGLQVRGAGDSEGDDRRRSPQRATPSPTWRGSFRIRRTSASSTPSRSVSASPTTGSTPTSRTPATRLRLRYLWPWTTCILAGDFSPAT